MRFYKTGFAALLLAAASQPALAQSSASVATIAETQDKAPIWAFEESDLPVDPDFRFGLLPNGMRYIIRHNATPEGQGQVRFFVDGGSLYETEKERGLAHFIEHMAFNGSVDVPEGEMIKLLEREGLAFGADTNASTGFEATTYKLDLPRNDESLLGTALMLMRETASQLLFNPDAIDRERGVVLSEMRVRDTYSMRNTLDSFDFFYPGARFTQRLPIGTKEALNAADADTLKGLYHRIYTPDNATLVVVGDFDPDTVERLIKTYFSRWEAPKAPPEPDAGPVDLERKGLTDVYIDPALSERVTAMRNGVWKDEPDTVANRQIGLLRQVGYGIVNRRFQRLANGDNPPFRGAGFGTSDTFEAARSTNLIVDSGDGEWREGLTAAVTEYRKAMEFGFSEGEVAEQLANIRTRLESAAAGADTRSTASLTGAALALVDEETIPTTPQTALERFEQFAPSITPETVLAALREDVIPLDDPLIRFEGRTAPEGGADALRATWDDAMATPVEPDSIVENADFAYTDFGPAGTVVSDTMDERLDIRTLRFANGVRLNLKPTDLKQDRIRFEVNLDGGDMLNTRDNPLATAMIGNLPLGGLGKHSYDELQSITAGRNVSLSIGSDAETFRMQGTVTPEDLELQLDLVTALITDPAYRSQGENRYRRSVADFFARKDATPSSALSSEEGGILSDGDPRFSLQPEEAYLEQDFAKLKDAIADRLEHGAIELALVGDFDPDTAIALVAKTLGALPAREEDFLPYADNRQRGFTTDRSARTLYHKGEKDQAMLRHVWPTRDDSDLQEAVKFALLERVMRLKLTDVLREELGQTYSPGVNSSLSRTYDDYGTFSLTAAVKVDDVAAANDAMETTVAALIAGSIDEDTLLRARRPVLEQLENALKTNGGWMGLVDRAQSEEERIGRFLATREILESLTAEDIRATAEHYLSPEDRLEITVLPAETDAESDAIGDE